jgi:hypothetical protein
MEIIMLAAEAQEDIHLVVAEHLLLRVLVEQMQAMEDPD